jgi:hypothetical protein
MKTPVGLPTLDEVAASPSILDSLPLPALTALARQVEHLAADTRIALMTRVLNVQADGKGEADEVLLIEAAATLLKTSTDSLHTKWKHLPFAYKDPLDGRLKFSRRGIERYIASRVHQKTA